MYEYKIPDFLTRKIEMNEEKKKYIAALEAYWEKFGYDSFSTEDKIMSEEEWTRVLSACVEQDMEVDEYLGLGDIEPGDEI